MISTKIVIPTMLAFGALAAPLTPASRSHLQARCGWDDGHGGINCDFFSVVFGDNDVFGGKGAVMIKGNGWETSGNLDCSNGHDTWTSFHHGALPWTVDIHGGNACDTTFSGHYDGVWIKYANQWLDTPSDTRCGPVNQLNKGRRCIIPLHP